MFHAIYSSASNLRMTDIFESNSTKTWIWHEYDMNMQLERMMRETKRNVDKIVL